MEKLDTGLIALILVIIGFLANFLGNINKIRKEYGSIKGWYIDREKTKEKRAEDISKLQSGFNELTDRLDYMEKRQDSIVDLSISTFRDQFRTRLDTILTRKRIYTDEIDDLAADTKLYENIQKDTDKHDGIQKRLERIKSLPIEERNHD